MKASAEKFIAFIHPDQRRPNEHVAVLTWRLGHRGPGLVRGASESEVREKLRRLDASVRFHQWRQAHSGGERVNENATTR
jgi:hypothetical protein